MGAIGVLVMRDFVMMLKQYRFVWISGRFGGGKTTLSLKLADRLVGSRFVRYTVVNFPLFVDAPCTVIDESEARDVEDAVLLLDEAGQFLDTGASPKRLREWFSYLRKNNQVVLMASVLPVSKFAGQFRCQRLFNGLQMGLPFWLYQWHLGVGDTKDKGRFLWWQPSEVWGLYDTNYKPDNRWYVYDWQDDGDGDGEAAECMGIESELVPNVVSGGDPIGDRVGGKFFLELSRVGARTSVSESASHSNGASVRSS